MRNRLNSLAFGINEALRLSICTTHGRRMVIEYAQRKCGDQEESMDYHKIKALMEASREKSTGQREPEPKEFPKPDSSQIGNISVR